ncbi:unnamed protein product [Citrullus colocynthis]|uniref:Knottins-like domain-containing protein n=1 Tax=Citrullus colocynthis TaxID=252529 RepID=A0ABP0XK05_9ROSI
MAGEGLRKLTAVVIIFLALASGWMVVQTEGLTCYKPSTAFQGTCNSAEECGRVCFYQEGWDDGFCSGDKCICTQQCCC